MPLLVLLETSAGFALYSVKDEDKAQISAGQDVADFEPTLRAFSKFENTTEALAAATSLTESKMPHQLKKFLKSSFKKYELTGDLAVADPKLGGAIKEKLGINCVFDAGCLDLMKLLRMDLEKTIPPEEMRRTSLGLAHSLSRFKLKFSPDKIDVMIVQAIALLDELDKELNTYAMRIREWYGWHFPELNKVIADNIQYARAINKMGLRHNCLTTDFSDILATDVEAKMKEAVHVTMGVDITEDDIANIRALCDQVIEMSEYRTSLHEYLKNRMQAVAPNLSVLVGELVGARLIAHAGSLLSLAKHPASTVQILGAEKALFRALKTQHATPKYGLIYHASMVGKATPKNKGKAARMLANKLSLASRVDALGESTDVTVGTAMLQQLENRMRMLDSVAPPRVSHGKGTPAKAPAYSKGASYSSGTDQTMTTPKSAKKPRKSEEEEAE
ncbi:putative Nucleolar protein 58 [Paratrimastix pyriformis]|uniref:Nucleolar protein 58 n=1 Tax=Paratrimastix pyriformis TaxID=342808 RepID=A0ABQ8URK7_9EUKA|nr:putative Nucleolar protein 58 [Paratrimastix pyriformis]